MFNKNILSLSVAAIIAYGAPVVQAQEDQIEEIIVTGIRASLAKSIDVKRENFAVVDAIVAEDIGKFPDNNVIEALQRVTGIQVTDRGAGEASTISIRGLTDINTTVNGRNIFTASGLSVALADVPASLIRQVDVFKTRSASQIENGIAGTVDIHTQRPFDFDGSKIVVAARAINQEQSDKTDPNISALASNRWDTGKGEFGALVNVSMAKTNFRDQSVTAGAMVPFATDNPLAPYGAYERIFLDHGAVAENPIWQPGQLNGLPTAPGSTIDINGQPMEYILARDAIFASDLTGERERSAANISLQYAPNDTSEYLFEAFYNGYRNETVNSLFFSFADWWGEYANNPDAANVELYDGTNIVKSRSVLFPYGFTSGDLVKGETDSFVYALGGKWQINDALTVKSEVVYQDSEYNESFAAMRFEKTHYELDVDFNAGGGVPAFGFNDNPNTAGIDESDLNDLSQWKSAQFYDSAITREGDAFTFTTDANWELNNNFFTSVDFGLRIDERTASEGNRKHGRKNTAITDYDSYFIYHEAPYNNTIPLTELDGIAHVNSGFFDGKSNVPSSWSTPNGHYLQKNIDAMRTHYNSTLLPMVNGFDIEELTTSAYVTAKFETELGGRVLDGEVGVRYTASDTDMSFTDIDKYLVNPNSDYASQASASTSKLLPSLTLRYHLTDDLVARFAYTETLRRPNFGQLNANINYAEDVTNIGYGTASGGNPNLKPTESQNYDLSLEWYFEEGSSLYGTLFKREIEGFVVDFRRQIQRENSDGEMKNYVISQPYNASNGELEGLELGAIWFPNNLPSYLDGFGIQASYTALNSSQSTPLTNTVGEITGYDETDLFGVSDESYSVVLAYDKNDLGVRLSYTWRSEFLNNYEAAQFANPLEVWRKPESSLDLQVSYQVNDNLSLTLDGTNLTEEIYQSYYGKNGATTNNFGSSLYSRTFAIGARFTY